MFMKIGKAKSRRQGDKVIVLQEGVRYKGGAGEIFVGIASGEMISILVCIFIAWYISIEEKTMKKLGKKVGASKNAN